MGYSVGDTVVYPHHGAAVVEKKEQRERQGALCEYLVLRVTHGDLTLHVPEDSCIRIGIRDVVSGPEIDAVMAVLRAGDSEARGSWSRRFKANYERLRSGDLHQVAAVVRNLSTRGADNGLSAGERRMLSKAKQILFSELCVALGRPEAEVEELVEQILSESHG